MRQQSAASVGVVCPGGETSEVASTRKSEPSVGLQFPSGGDRIIQVTQNQRKGRLMSRRCGQNGYIERKGRWWHLRFWFDCPEGRIHKSQPICLAAGKEKKTKSEAERLGKEWLAKQGINTKEHLAKATRIAVTFREQSQIWLNWLQTRNNKPIPQSSVPSIKSALNRWLLPELGGLSLSAVDERALNAVVNKMISKLSPKTIKTYINMAKEIVKSQRDENGKRITHAEWDNEVIDLPPVHKRQQRRPKLRKKEDITKIIDSCETPWERMLYTLCPATGMRIAEALALDIEKHISAEYNVIYVRQQVKGCKTVEYLKTGAAYRDIDLCRALATMLREYVGNRTSGLLFPSQTGTTPMSYSNVRSRSLHPKLVKLNLYTPGAATNMYRRFRTSILVKNECPEDLKKFWLGHENSDITAEYAEQIREDVEWRQRKAAEIGVGFELSSVAVPNVPKAWQQEEVAVAV